MTDARWERAAELYATGEHSSGDELDLAVEFAAPTGTERVLDIGAGAGHMALAMAARVQSVVLTDPVEAMLEASRRVFREAGRQNAEFLKASAESLPFDAASFDIVTSRLAAHHFDDVNLALREIARVLKPSGRFILVDTLAPGDGESAQFLHEVEVLRDPTHRHAYTTDEWTRLCEAASLHVDRVEFTRKGHEFEPWLKRGGEDAATLSRVRARFLAAPASVRSELIIVVRDGAVVSFTDRKLVLSARR